MADEKVIKLLEEMCEALTRNTVPDPVFKRIKKAHSKFVRDALNVQKCGARLEKLNKDIELLKDNKIPPHLKAYKL
eukprot:9084579-Karenia_brevis.AAC.1